MHDRRTPASKESCDDILNLLSGYSDGSLTSIEDKRITRHLRICRACKAEVTILKAFEATLGRLEEEPPPPELTRRIMAQLSGQTPETHSTWDAIAGLFKCDFSWRLAAVGSMALFVLMIAFSFLSFSGGGLFMAHEAGDQRHVLQDVSADVTVSGGKVSLGERVVDGSLNLEELKPGMTLRVAPEETAVLSRADGSRFVATLEALVEIAPGGLSLREGRLDVSLYPSSRGFYINTPQVSIVVRGTVYSVSVTNRSTIVRVREGAVTVSRLDGSQPVILRAGESIEADDSSSFRRPTEYHDPDEPATQSEDTYLLFGDQN